MDKKYDYTNGIAFSLQKASQIAKQCGIDYVGTDSFLYGILCLPNCTACKFLNKYGVTMNSYHPYYLKSLDKNFKNEGRRTPEALSVLEKAKQLADFIGVGYLSTEHILYTILQDQNCKGYSILNRMGINTDMLCDEIYSILNSTYQKIVQDKEKAESKDGDKEQEENPLSKLGIDLTLKAEQGKLDPVIGRSKEIEKIIESLSRRMKNSPVLVGEAGVGKSAVVEGLAQEIVNGNVPDSLTNKRIFSLDLSCMLAGAKYRGEFEERFKKAIDYIKDTGNIIVFIDEIHNIMGAGSTSDSNFDMGEMLKPMLARGELQTIGATTIDEYRKYIEKDPAMERRFQPILIKEPTVEDTIQIIKGLKDKYEAHHKINITDEAIEYAVKLSNRYITDRNLPDKAIDLIDECLARARMKFTLTPSILAENNQKLKTLYLNKKYAELDGSDLNALKKIDVDINECKKEIADLQRKLNEIRSLSNPSINGENIAELIAEKTNIPVTKLSEEESEKLLNLEYSLHERVIGQELAIQSVSKAIRRSRANLKDPNRPIGTFMFVGTTGVGKTELSKALADIVFGDENSLIRFDMSEYMETNSVSKLIGAPPGYVGYEEAGQLTDRVKRKPYSVVLFDEIEKASPDVLNLMLQLLDEGRLTDSKGKVVNFKNTIIILTSNVGSQEVLSSNLIGFNNTEDAQENLKSRIENALKRKFKPEFLNRLDDIVVFTPLSREECSQIIELNLEKLCDRLKQQDIGLMYANSAVEFLLNKGYDEKYGARPLKRVILRYIEDVLSEKIISGELISGDKISIYSDMNKLIYKIQERM